VKQFGFLLAAVVGLGLLAYLFFALMVSLIPPGEPVARAVPAEAYNDPNDLTPREPVLPPGPHQDEFLNNCTACHSTRLTLTQPVFPKAKWTEVVHKMVATYGAKITPEVEEQIAQYLVAVKGPRP
jgi:hypothetical protein